VDATVVIVGAGAVSPIGLSLPETAASARARLARLREIEWRDRRFEPFVVGTVPDEGLPPLAAALADAHLQYREGRMLRLAQVALEEALIQLPTEVAALPLLLGLPEHHTTQPIDPASFIQRLILQVQVPITRDASVAVPTGRAAGLIALRQARTRLLQGDHEFILVGGVDSLVDLYVLGTLDLQGRIRNAVNSDGFSPAEGAAFLLLCTAETARRRALSVSVAVSGCTCGNEPGHLYADAPYLGEGLAAAVGALLAEAPPSPPVGCVFSSFNGERYWGREFGVARLRNAAAFADDHQIEHPAECFGDLGAAHGPMLAALAYHGLLRGYRRSPCLVYASSDYGERGAALFERITT
jgi:3-oxoacyl-[acyl-carrier-protein] synthase I